MKYLNALFLSYAEILFIQNRYIGIFLLLVTFLYPNIAIAGVISVSIAILFALFINMHESYIKSGFYIYNPLLVGMSIGYLFAISTLTILLIAIASILTFLFTVVLEKIFAKESLPILSIPFTIVSTIIYLASYNYSNLFAIYLYNHTQISSLEEILPDFFIAFF